MSHRKRREPRSAAPEPCVDRKVLTQQQLDEELRKFKRHLMTYYELYNACPDAGCRRAHRCAQPDAPCFEAALPFIRETIFPQLMPEIERRAAAWRAAHDADKPPESSL